MSAENQDSEYDLIDLHVKSPVLPRAPANFETYTETSDNLIDTELPILEQKLQTASNIIPPQNDSRRPSVDIEDILISIDGEDEVDAPNKISNQFLDLCDNNFEALSVLKNLDDVLNASLLESDDVFNDTEETESIQTQQDIEDCLQDLDNYLKAIDSSSCDDYSDESNLSVCMDDQPSDASSTNVAGNHSFADGFEGASETIEEENLRNKLRQMEENYTKFLASGFLNRGYVDTETNNTDRRPLSACGAVNETDNRNYPARATVAVVNRERPSIHRIENSIKSRCHSDRTSAPAGKELYANWGCMQDAESSVNLERRAHAAGDCCTGTVVVELPRASATQSSSSDTAMNEEPKHGSRNNTWLRSSMRRLRHLRLPSDEVSSPIQDIPINEQVLEPEISRIQVPVISTTLNRPVSAPSRIPARTPSNSSRSRSRESQQSVVSHEPSGRARSSSNSSRSRRPRSLSSSESSIPSSEDSTPSCTTAASPTTQTTPQNNATTSPRRSCDRNRQTDMPEVDSPLGQWPHSLSSMMACLGCTLGLFNISRFAILTVHFGANFIFQFILLTLLFGLPLLTLQLCLGQQLGAGVIDMWRISPLFQGVGVSLLIAQALMGLYSIIGVSWMFVFFRDSFITKTDRYRWAEPFQSYRRESQNGHNDTVKLSETVPAYFNGVVLQRQHLPSENTYGTIKFQLAFNLAVVWMIVFVSLSKGLRSYGKVVYAFTLLPVIGTFILCAKLLGLMPQDYVNVIFPETSWSEFFSNSKSWLAAGQEMFLTWGVLGAAIMQIASHNKHKHLLQRDSSLVAVITLTILLLAGFLANTCVQILRANGYSYLPSSFERSSSVKFLRPSKDPLPPKLANTPIRDMVHNSFFLGDTIIKPDMDHTSESGYQVLRLATELVPATFAVMGADQVSPFWAVLFYFVLIMFGIAQQLAIWHCVITGIMAIRANILKSWETTITFFSCACGFILGLPMATEIGIYVVYFLDCTVGGLWWLLIVILLQVIAVFMVRGRPYSGDTIVTALFYQNQHPCFMSWAPALLSFTWNVIIPVVLMVLCIATFKNGSFRDMFIWHHAPVAEYWPLWARQVGSMLQLLPILIIPLVAVIQSYRYLNNGPNDILDRIQLLYRPPIGEHMDELAVQEAAAAIRSEVTAANALSEDPPPKYTPPPSYTTATGARLAKFLRQSLRRSVRRIANVLGEGTSRRTATNINQTPNPPPDYNEVLVEMNNTTNTGEVSVTMPVVTSSSNPRISTLERLRNLEASPTALTAAEVASILRSSFRRSTVRRNNNIRNATFNDNMTSLSAQNLVDSAAPIGETSLVMDNLPNSNNEYKIENNNTSSVI